MRSGTPASAPEDAAHRSHRQRRRELPQRLLHDVAVLAEPGLAAERRVRAPARRHRQLHRASGRARDVPESAAALPATPPPTSASGTWARTTTSRGPASTTSSRTRGRASTSTPSSTSTASAARSAPATTPRSSPTSRSTGCRTDHQRKPWMLILGHKAAAQLLHAGAEVRARLRRCPRAVSGVGVPARRQAGVDQGSPLHLARHLRPAVRLAQEVPRRSARRR